MTHTEKVKYIRVKTLSPINKINRALIDTGGDINKSIAWLIEQKAVDVIEMANRRADNNSVHSYVHNNRVGAMIVLASQTDFVAKNKLFVQLAKDICMHIVSHPMWARYIDENDMPEGLLSTLKVDYMLEVKNKPEAVAAKIVEGRIKKYLGEVCLIHQKFVKEDTITIKELIDRVSASMGEKIEIKRFVRMSS